MSDDLSIRSWRAARARDIAVEVHPSHDGEPFMMALTSELERLAEYARRVRQLLTARHQVDADTALQWIADAGEDDRRIVDILARLDALGERSAP